MPVRKKTGKAVSKKASKRQDEEVLVDEAPRQEAGRQVRYSRSDMKDAENRKKALGRLHPDVPKWMKENFGLDLNNERAVDTQTIWDLAQGKFTKALPLVIVPTAYDAEKKERVEMPKIKVMDSLRIDFPSENGKAVSPYDKNPFVETVPCRPLLEKSDGLPAESVAPAKAEGEQKKLEFTKAHYMALEGIGIERNRLYGGFNYLPRTVKEDIMEGRTFPVDGQVRTSGGQFVKVIGEARLDTAKDGSVTARFQSTYPETREENTIIDLRAARIQGNLEFDFYMRDSSRRVITDVNGQPLFNKQAENLAKYGMAMDFVMGRRHESKYDEKKGMMVDVPGEWEPYEVSVKDGNLTYKKARIVKELDENGEPLMVTDRSGKEVEKTHPEASVRTRDGKVFVEGQGVEPKAFHSQQDQENYLKGKPALVDGLVYHDFKTKEDITYTGVVVADNRSNGYGHAYTPATSEEIRKGMKERKVNRKKQDFGFSL